MPFLRRARLEIPASRDYRVGHLVVVAGPSGSGKSLFMKQLAARELHPDIATLLPGGVEAWPQTNGSRIFRGVPAASDSMPGMVLHYDIMRIFETVFDSYANDPALSVLARAESIIPISIQPSAEQLVKQLSRKGEDRTLLRRLRHAIRKLRRRASVDYRGSSDVRHARLRSLFRDPSFLDAFYARWRDFLKADFGEKVRPAILVEPDESRNGPAQFRLVPRS